MENAEGDELIPSLPPLRPPQEEEEAECARGAAPPHSHPHTQMRALALTGRTRKRPSALEVPHLAAPLFSHPCPNKSSALQGGL